jgi:hypothetical protein
MNKKETSEEDFMDVLKSGHQWHSNKIKDEIEQLLILNEFNHNLIFDTLEKRYHVYDNECFLSIFDAKIELRSDRENVSSEGKTIIYKINGADDILSAYEHFKALTKEDEHE